MKVVFLTSLVGDGVDHQPGSKPDLPKEQACRFIDGGICSPCGDAAKAEYKEYKRVQEAAVQTQLEREKKAAAILYRDELLQEKENLLNRVGEINADLEIEDVIIKKEDHQNLLDMAETVEVSKDEFLTLVGEAETITVPKLEHEKLVEAQTPKEDKKEGEE